MRLDDYIEGLEPDAAAERRRLAEAKSYEIIDHLDDVEARFDSVVQGDAVFGSTAPSVFVGRSNYPQVPAGILSPVTDPDAADQYATSGEWYERGLNIESILQYRTGLLNARRQTDVTTPGRTGSVHDVWEGFIGAQREVAIADRPVDVEIGLADTPNLDVGVDDVTTPTGPDATAESATVTENPHVPPAVEKTLEDDEWNAQGAMTYLYRRGFDVYDINTILSAGALGRGENRRLVPTRWSITAVDDTVGQYLRGQISNQPSIDSVEVYVEEYLGNRYWVVLGPGRWEFELVEMKAPGSVWNPDTTGTIWMGSAHEGFEGRTGYVEETAGAYYASRLGVLEHLADRGRQAKALVLREVSDEYWAPVGVWQVRESVRGAFDDVPGTAETFHGAVRRIVEELPVSWNRLRRKSALVSGVQADLSAYTDGPA
ncbi:MAG: DNA repair protein NreA [Halobacteriaceae archaeon]